MPPPPAEHTETELPPAGSHIAICCRLIDLGTQNSTFKGQHRERRKLYVEFQLPHELNCNGHPFVVGNRYTLSSSPKATLRQHLESWRGRKFTDAELDGFDLKNVLGKSAVITVIHHERSGKIYADIKAIAAIPKGTKPASLAGPSVMFSLEPGEYEHEVYLSLSDRLRGVIAASPEFQAVSPSDTREQPTGR
ncbi:phage replication initiation protein, NGO0469 family [Rhodopirellula sp. SWK7]|uniref:phage replication initiation protein, NGO0469 family n=1 Tax=Rhodopirellula sp. SWK7 TaxID=595460 RepID=UPI00396582E3